MDFCRYQTGALTPLIRWLSQGMQRAAAPPQPPRPAFRADNVPDAARQGNENAGLGGTFYFLCGGRKQRSISTKKLLNKTLGIKA